jgi:hypothetical protein
MAQVRQRTAALPALRVLRLGRSLASLGDGESDQGGSGGQMAVKVNVPQAAVQFLGITRAVVYGLDHELLRVAPLAFPQAGKVVHGSEAGHLPTAMCVPTGGIVRQQTNRPSSFTCAHDP